MQVSRNDQVEFASFQLNDIPSIWYTHLMENRGAEMNLRKGNMTVQQYRLKFNQLFRVVAHMVADSRA